MADAPARVTAAQLMPNKNWKAGYPTQQIEADLEGVLGATTKTETPLDTLEDVAGVLSQHPNTQKFATMWIKDVEGIGHAVWFDVTDTGDVILLDASFEFAKRQITDFFSFTLRIGQP